MGGERCWKVVASAEGTVWSMRAVVLLGLKHVVDDGLVCVRVENGSSLEPWSPEVVDDTGQGVDVGVGREYFRQRGAPALFNLAFSEVSG